MKPLSLIVAMSRNRVIGRGGALPWHLPEDLRRFKALTLGHAIVMGRRTFESIGRPLPGRRNIVVSSRAVEGVETAATLAQALELARGADSEPFVIGGEQLFRAALPLATRIHLTLLDRDVEGDTWFPPLDECWVETERRAAETPGVSFVTLERRPPLAGC